MTEETISSRKNPLAQRARAVRDGRDRARVFLEGVRLCEEALGAGLAFELVLYTQSLARAPRGRALVAALERVCRHVVRVTDGVIGSVADTDTPQGVVCVAARPPRVGDIFDERGGTPLVVVIHRVNNPSNVGAMLRAAEAAGATAVAATSGSADPLSPKALRGAMGSAFRLPLWAGASLPEVLGLCGDHGILTYAAAAGAGKTHTEVDWTAPCAVVMGPESGGLTTEESALARECVRIPMRPPVESLNVASALAVILYEAARQRGFEF